MTNSKKNPASIAAVVLNHNEAHHLKNSIGQIVNQSEPFDEILIIDDASTDNSVDIIRQITENVAFCVVQLNEKNMGVNENVYQALTRVKSAYIYLVSSRHSYSKEIVREFREKIEREPNLKMISEESHLFMIFNSYFNLWKVSSFFN